MLKMGCSVCGSRGGSVSPFMSVNVSAPNTSNINPYNQTLEMIEALQLKLQCFLQKSVFPNTTEMEVRIYEGYILSMINLQDIYRYNIQPYYQRIINETC